MSYRLTGRYYDYLRIFPLLFYLSVVCSYCHDAHITIMCAFILVNTLSILLFAVSHCRPRVVHVQVLALSSSSAGFYRYFRVSFCQYRGSDVSIHVLILSSSPPYWAYSSVHSLLRGSLLTGHYHRWDKDLTGILHGPNYLSVYSFLVGIMLPCIKLSNAVTFNFSDSAHRLPCRFYHALVASSPFLRIAIFGIQWNLA